MDDMRPSFRAPLSAKRRISLHECLNITGTRKARLDRATPLEAKYAKSCKVALIRLKFILFLYIVLFLKFINVIGMRNVLKKITTPPRGRKQNRINVKKIKKKKIKILMSEHGVMDLWREIPPTGHDYTHYSHPRPVFNN